MKSSPHLRELVLRHICRARLRPGLHAKAGLRESVCLWASGGFQLRGGLRFVPKCADGSQWIVQRHEIRQVVDICGVHLVCKRVGEVLACDWVEHAGGNKSLDLLFLLCVQRMSPRRGAFYWKKRMTRTTKQVRSHMCQLPVGTSLRLPLTFWAYTSKRLLCEPAFDLRNSNVETLGEMFRMVNVPALRQFEGEFLQCLRIWR